MHGEDNVSSLFSVPEHSPFPYEKVTAEDAEIRHISYVKSILVYLPGGKDPQTEMKDRYFTGEFYYRYVVIKNGGGMDIIDAIPMLLDALPLTEPEKNMLKRAEKDFEETRKKCRELKAAPYFTKSGILSHILAFSDIMLVLGKYGRDAGFRLGCHCGYDAGHIVLHTESCAFSDSCDTNYESTAPALPFAIRTEIFAKAADRASEAVCGSAAKKSGNKGSGILKYNMVFILTAITEDGLLAYMQPYFYRENGRVHVRYAGVDGNMRDEIISFAEFPDPTEMIRQIGRWENAVALIGKTGETEYWKYRGVVEDPEKPQPREDGISKTVSGYSVAYGSVTYTGDTGRTAGFRKSEPPVPRIDNSKPVTRVIIAGSRNFDDYDLLRKKCGRLLKMENVEIVSGHARGADTLGEKFAEENGIPLKVFPAQWDTYGKAAGPIRNRQMAEYAAQADCGFLVAFPKGESNGTRNMIRTAKWYDLTVYVVES